MNRIILIGNLARDPELKTTQSGLSVCNFTVAVNRRVPNAQGEREVDFINCVAWRKTAELVSNYFTKGRKIAVEGTLQMRSYEAKDGSKRTAAEVVVDNVEFVDKAPIGQGTRQNTPPAANDGFVDVADDELPF